MSTLRVSTAGSYESTIARLQQRQRELSDAQVHMTSGKRVMRASDDPINAARAERALAGTARAQAGLRAVDASRSAMTQTEAALGDAGELLQQVREALVASGNAGYDDSQRKVLGDQIRSLRDQLLTVANRGDGAGGYLFGGQGSATPPFLDAPDGVQYVGTRGQINADRTDGLPMTMDGDAAWMTAPTGNGVFETRAVGGSGNAWIDAGRVTDPTALTGASYSIEFSVSGARGGGGARTPGFPPPRPPTPQTGVAYVSGQAISVDGIAFAISGAPADGDIFEAVPSAPSLSVFDALDAAARELATPMRSKGAIAQTTASSLRDVDSLLARLSSSRSAAGEALGRIDNVGATHDAASTNGQIERSKAEDLDLTAAISDFQNRQLGYQAALQTYASVQRLSLFDYLK